jgi:hypothetical protein
METEELVLKAEAVAESQITLEGDKNPDIEGQVAEVKSAGYVKMYDTRTGELSLCNRNVLRHHLEKKRPDGSLVFTTVKPKFAPKRGTLKCMLHPDSPDREIYDRMGLPVCMKSNLTSPYQVIRHMQKRHKVEYATIKEEEARIERERVRAERKQDREIQEAILKAASSSKEAPLYVSDKEKKK